MGKGKYDVWCRSCGCVMKRRSGKYGEFYGCTGYPVCKQTMNLQDAAMEPETHELERRDRGME